MLAIPRGIIYHSIFFEIKSLFCSFVCDLNVKEAINNFENQFSHYMGTKYCIAFPFARTAIYYSLKAQSFPVGTEIIMPPITIKGILDVVLNLGLKPIFVDIDKDTLCFDLNALRKSITNNTKVILITYLYGIVPDMEALISICKQQKLFIIEDFSHNLNATFKDKKLGTYGNIGVYSSSSVKTLDTFGGGLLVTSDTQVFSVLQNYNSNLNKSSRKFLIKKILINLIRNIATNRFLFNFITSPLIKIFKYFSPDDIMKYTGTKDHMPINDLPLELFFSFTSLQAKVGSEILNDVSKLDTIRVNNVSKIISNVKNICIPQGNVKGGSIYWQLPFYSDDTRKHQEYFHANKIDTSTTSLINISSLSLYPYQGITPIAKKLYTSGVFIPSYPGLNDRDINYIINVLNKILNLKISIY